MDSNITTLIVGAIAGLLGGGGITSLLLKVRTIKIETKAAQYDALKKADERCTSLEQRLDKLQAERIVEADKIFELEKEVQRAKNTSERLAKENKISIGERQMLREQVAALTEELKGTDERMNKSDEAVANLLEIISERLGGFKRQLDSIGKRARGVGSILAEVRAMLEEAGVTGAIADKLNEAAQEADALGGDLAAVGEYVETAANDVSNQLAEQQRSRPRRSQSKGMKKGQSNAQ